ncbi:hypothetical protein DU19_1002 [Chlamydia muridarum]|nr:hypothetical protein DU18_1002 [Chlamydia muridarum]KDU82387.1 hypothetical protein DU19_1002 [Chlamydia muridarum]
MIFLLSAIFPLPLAYESYFSFYFIVFSPKISTCSIPDHL